MNVNGVSTEWPSASNAFATSVAVSPDFVNKRAPGVTTIRPL